MKSQIFCSDQKKYSLVRLFASFSDEIKGVMVHYLGVEINKEGSYPPFIFPVGKLALNLEAPISLSKEKLNFVYPS